ERVPAVRAARRGQGEIRGERQALRLREDRLQPAPVGPDELDLSQDAQLDHEHHTGRLMEDGPAGRRAATADSSRPNLPARRTGKRSSRNPTRAPCTTFTSVSCPRLPAPARGRAGDRGPRITRSGAPRRGGGGVAPGSRRSVPEPGPPRSRRAPPPGSAAGAPVPAGRRTPPATPRAARLRPRRRSAP